MVHCLASPPGTGSTTACTPKKNTLAHRFAVMWHSCTELAMLAPKVHVLGTPHSRRGKLSFIKLSFLPKHPLHMRPTPGHRCVVEQYPHTSCNHCWAVRNAQPWVGLEFSIRRLADGPKKSHNGSKTFRQSCQTLCPIWTLINLYDLFTLGLCSRMSSSKLFGLPF